MRNQRAFHLITPTGKWIFFLEHNEKPNHVHVSLEFA